MSFAIYPKRTKLVFALASLKKDADEKRKTLILLFSPAFILKIQKMHPTSIFGCKKGCKSRNYLIYTLCCGEGGIRTPGSSQINGFQDRRNRPLCHLSFRFGIANVGIIFFYAKINCFKCEKSFSARDSSICVQGPKSTISLSLSSCQGRFLSFW